jgi:hypothetical protein
VNEQKEGCKEEVCSVGLVGGGGGGGISFYYYSNPLLPFQVLDLGEFQSDLISDKLYTITSS